MKNIFLIFGMLAPLLSFAHSIEDAPDPLKLDGLMKAFGWDMDNAEIRHEKIYDGISVLFGLGGNIGVSIGDDGVFIIDDQFPQLMPKIEKVIAGLGGGDIDFAVTTHWHFDHAEGNQAFGTTGSTIIAHENSREFMKNNNFQWIKKIISNIFGIHVAKAYLNPLASFINYILNRQYANALVEFEKLNADQKIYFQSSYHFAKIYNANQIFLENMI